MKVILDWWSGAGLNIVVCRLFELGLATIANGPSLPMVEIKINEQCGNLALEDLMSRQRGQSLLIVEGRGGMKLYIFYSLHI